MLRRRRGGERGQTLVLAIAFLAAFGLLAAAVLTFADEIQVQRRSTENTAASNAITSGSTQLALSDAGIAYLHGLGCATGSETMTFPNGATLQTKPSGACQAVATTSVSDSSGSNCSLCIINEQNVSSPLSLNFTLADTLFAQGEIDVNGSIALNSAFSNVVSNTGIGLYGTGASCSGGFGGKCTPAPVALSAAVQDPYGRRGSGSKVTYTSNGLTDTGASWTPDQFAGGSVRATISGGSVVGTVAGNSANTITLTANWATQPASGAAYWATQLPIPTPATSPPSVTTAAANTIKTICPGTYKNLTAAGFASSVLYLAPNSSPACGSTATPSVYTITGTLSTANGYTASVVADGSVLYFAPGATINASSSGNVDVDCGLSTNGGGAGVAAGTVTYGAKTLTDSSQNFSANLVGATVTVTHAGSAVNATVASVSATTLTMTANWSTLPSTNDAYSVARPGGTCSLATSTAPSSGAYAGVAAYFDPSNTSTLSVSVFSAAAIDGTLEAPATTVANTLQAAINVYGRMVVSQMSATASLFSGDILNVNYTAATSYCYYYSEQTGSNSARLGYVRFETGCSSGGTQPAGATAIVNYGYSTFP